MNKKINSYNTTKVRQLADAISLSISMNEYKTGELLPSINSLSKNHDVSRDTVFKALQDLRERGFVDSIPGKGYFVKNKLNNVLLLLDEYTPFKDELYNSFIKSLTLNYKVDLLFHQYNVRLFNTIIRESLGKYNKYIVMNFDNECLSKNLQSLGRDKLLLLDFGKFDKGEYSFVCQNFDESFYNALCELKDRMTKYKRAVFIFRKESKHPQVSKMYFKKFFDEQSMESLILDNMEGFQAEKGVLYVVIKQQDVVAVVKNGREANLKCGQDYGLIAYNDIPSYEVIDEGITALSIDWSLMGKEIADFVLNDVRVRKILPTEVRLRNSI